MTMGTEASAQTASGDVAIDDSAPHLLVIDDDSRIRDLLSRYLGERGFRVTAASDAGDARRRLAELEFDLLIVDVMMPGETGLELTRSLRETMNVPILMLTARAETDARIEGLEYGADDYLAKPFEPRELLCGQQHPEAGPATATPLIEAVRFGPYTFNREQLELRKGSEMIRLTDREKQIMAIFAAAPGETVPRTKLIASGGPSRRTNRRRPDQPPSPQD